MVPTSRTMNKFSFNFCLIFFLWFLFLSIWLHAVDWVFRLHLYHQLLKYWKVESGPYFICILFFEVFFSLLIRICPLILVVYKCFIRFNQRDTFTVNFRCAVDAVLTCSTIKMTIMKRNKKKEIAIHFLNAPWPLSQWKYWNYLRCCPSVWFQSNPWRVLRSPNSI